MGTLWTLESSQPTLSMYSALPLAYGTSYYAISLSANIILTLLIIGRLVSYRRTLIQSLPAESANHYISLAAVIIESAALYSVFAILFLITYAVNNPTNQVWLAVASACQVRLPFLSAGPLAIDSRTVAANREPSHHLPAGRWERLEERHAVNPDRDPVQERVQPDEYQQLPRRRTAGVLWQWVVRPGCGAQGGSPRGVIF
jgi:hypothetical protein